MQPGGMSWGGRRGRGKSMPDVALRKENSPFVRMGKGALVAQARIELATPRSSGECSTN